MKKFFTLFAVCCFAVSTIGVIGCAKEEDKAKEKKTGSVTTNQVQVG